MKFAIFLLDWWLTPNPKQRLRVEVLGVGTMIVLYAFEILFFCVLY